MRHGRTLFVIASTITLAQCAYFDKQHYEECMIHLSLSGEYEGIKRCTVNEFAVGRSVQLGKGNYSKVILAVEEKTGEEMAIKTVYKMDDPRNFMAFKREACFLSSWTNALPLIPHFHCIIHPLIQESDRPMASIVMEYIKGPTLLDYCDLNGKKSDQMVPTVLQYIGTTIDLLHSNGFLHRDIKPDNIIIEEQSGIPRLIDFGSCGLEWQPDYQMFALGHMSPELLRRVMHTADGQLMDWQGMWAADWYALGVTVYTMSTGSYPIPDDMHSTNMIKLYILQGISERSFLNGMPRESLFKGLMNKVVEKRWSFVQIREYLEGNNC